MVIEKATKLDADLAINFLTIAPGGTLDTAGRRVRVYRELWLTPESGESKPWPCEHKDDE